MGEPIARGTFPAARGQTVTVTVQCDRGVYCTAYAATGVVAASDQPAVTVAAPASGSAQLKAITVFGQERSNFAAVTCVVEATGVLATRVEYCEIRDHDTGFQDSIGAGMTMPGAIASATTVGYDYGGLFDEVCMAGFVDWGSSVVSLTERCFPLGSF
jgi:hypothetical protein